jgi:hypothetical protein
MKKIRRDKPIGAIIHIYMEIPQGRNSLCSYLYLKQAKMSCFLFYLSSFFFYKIGERAEQDLPREEAGTSGRGEVMGKESRRVNVI